MTSVGSRSGVNWIRRKEQPSDAGDRLGQHGLAGARHVLDEQMSLTQQRHQCQPHLGVLAHDHPLDVGGDALSRTPAILDTQRPRGGADRCAVLRWTIAGRRIPRMVRQRPSGSVVHGVGRMHRHQSAKRRSHAVMQPATKGHRVVAAGAGVLDHHGDGDPGLRRPARSPRTRNEAPGPGPSCAVPLLPAVRDPGHLGATRIRPRVATLHGPDHRVAQDRRQCSASHHSADDPRLDACLVAVRRIPAGPRAWVASSRRRWRWPPPTSAIWSGVTSTSACPYAALASSTRSAKPSSGPSPPLTWLADVGSSNSMADPKPKRAATDDSRRRPGLQAGVGEPDVAGHLHRLVQVQGMRPAAPSAPRPGSGTRRGANPRRDSTAGRRTWCRDRWRPISRPAAAVTSLNTDPGTYRPWVARSSSGASASPSSVRQIVPARGRVGSAAAGRTSGVLTSARTRPVDGSMATTAPRRSPRRRAASSWKRTSTDSHRSDGSTHRGGTSGAARPPDAVGRGPPAPGRMSAPGPPCRTRGSCSP